MNILEKAEQRYRKDKYFGIRFSIGPEAYDCRLGDKVSFGDNTTYMGCGVQHNYQPILLDGKEIGVLHEWQRGRLFDPMVCQFELPLDDEVSGELRNNPHFVEDEWNHLSFATLNQLLDYLQY